MSDTFTADQCDVSADGETLTLTFWRGDEVLRVDLPYAQGLALSLELPEAVRGVCAAHDRVGGGS